MKPRISKLTVFVLVAVIILTGEVGWLVYRLNRPSLGSSIDNGATATSSSQFFSKLDGTVVSSTEEVDATVLGVMLDNHPDARPQSGLSDARIVYEAPVEGGITRYFAVFNSKDNISKVGPVRSARPYFLDWLSEYGDSPYWHCGGSPQALELIKQFGVRDVDQFFNDRYFWRSTDREAPHNLYTDSEKWAKYFSNNTPSKKWQGWNFGALSATVSSTEMAGVNIIYSSLYKVGWQYDEDTGKFVRFINGKRQTDQAYNSIYADTVVLQLADVQVIDDEGRREIATVGEGKAKIFRDGKVIKADWKKTDRASRTRFYDESGKEIPFKAGKIWIEIVPSDAGVEMAS